MHHLETSNGTQKRAIEGAIAKCLKAEGQPFGISELLNFSESSGAIVGRFEATNGATMQFELSTVLRFD
jgi:hypothetical protein